MKIKILKIKVTSENQDFDFSEFFEGSNTIFKTNSQLVKDDEGYTWYVFITYEPKSYSIPVSKYEKEKAKLPAGFEYDVFRFMEENPPKNTRTKNSVRQNIHKVIDVKSLEDFYLLRNLGEGTIKDDKVFFTRLLDEIIIKYN